MTRTMTNYEKEQHAKAMSAVRLRELRDAAAEALPKVPEGPLHERLKMAISEIGRASCRERVSECV